MIDILLKQMGFRPAETKAQVEAALKLVNTFDQRLATIAATQETIIGLLNAQNNRIVAEHKTQQPIRAEN